MRKSTEKIVKVVSAVTAVLSLAAAVSIYHGHEPSVRSMIIDQVVIAFLLLDAGWRTRGRS